MKHFRSIILSLTLASLMVLTGCEEKIDYWLGGEPPMYSPVLLKVYDPEGNDLLLESTPHNILHRLTENQKVYTPEFGLSENLNTKEQSLFHEINGKVDDLGPFIWIGDLYINNPCEGEGRFYLGWRPMRIYYESTITLHDPEAPYRQRGVAKFYFDDKLVAEHRDDDVMIVPITIDWYDAEY